MTSWLLLAAALAAPLPACAGSDIFTYGRCQHLAPAERARMEALDRTTTAGAARRAQREIGLRLGAALTEPARREVGPTRLAAAVEGWLLKKEWLGARARHEHDADEAVAYCEFLRRRAGLAHGEYGADR